MLFDGGPTLVAGRTADNVRELEVLTHDGLRLRVGRTSEDELDRIIRDGGRRGEIYRRIRELRDRYAERIRERFPAIARRISGYNLPQLLPENGFHLARALVGSEGTCVTVLEATVDLIPAPKKKTLMLVAFDDAYHAADYVPEVIEAGPIAVEGIDDRLIDDNRMKGWHPDGRSTSPR